VSRGAEEAMEREAQRMYAELLAGREARLTTAQAAANFRSRVTKRVFQLLSGDVRPCYEDMDD
jgi:hypothetical protein